MPLTSHPTASRLPHLMCVLLACATFPLIFVGGLVTTTGAGMAFDDWPTTEGYFIFFYPLERWLGGGWSGFIEHTHRVLGAVVGILCLIAAAMLMNDSRRGVRWLAAVAVAAVIFQGVLGGLRVIQNEQLLAMVHGSFGPLFFALCVALAVLTSRRWRESTPAAHAGASSLRRLAVMTAGLCYLQIVLGALLRHAPATGGRWFTTALAFHILAAAVLLIHAYWLAGRVCWKHRFQRGLMVPSVLLAVLVTLQLALGGGTWVTNYGWPGWFEQYSFSERFLVVAGSSAQTLITTAHVTTGSLILAASVVLALRSWRLLEPEKTRGSAGGAKRTGLLTMEVAG